MSNRITLIPGVSAQFTIVLTDLNGDLLTSDVLSGAEVKFFLRTDPAGSNTLFFQTPDPVHILVDENASNILLALTSADTAGLTLGAYFYQVELDLADGEVRMPVQWTPLDVTLGGSAATPPPPFLNTVKIDENYQLPGDLAYFTPGGTPISGAQVRVYYATDYDAGNLDSPIAITTTNAAGGWTNPILVLPGYEYVARFEQPNAYGPDVARFTA